VPRLRRADRVVDHADREAITARSRRDQSLRDLPATIRLPPRPRAMTPEQTLITVLIAWCLLSMLVLAGWIIVSELRR
jgi:hypothetical protein